MFLSRGKQILLKSLESAGKDRNKESAAQKVESWLASSRISCVRQRQGNEQLQADSHDYKPDDTCSQSDSEELDDSLHDPDYEPNSTEDESDIFNFFSQTCEKEKRNQEFVELPTNPSIALKELDQIISVNGPDLIASSTLDDSQFHVVLSGFKETAQSWTTDHGPVEHPTTSSMALNELNKMVGDSDQEMCNPPEASNLQALNKAKISDRPSRPCPFCDKFFVRLTRHIRTVHKNDDRVKEIDKRSKVDQRSAFRGLKREGMKNYNLSKVGMHDFNHTQLLRERKARKDNSVVICDQCYGTFSKIYYFRHRSHCIGDSAVAPKAIAAQVFYCNSSFSEDFKLNVLNKFLSDEIGTLCQRDALITLVGSRLYTKLKGRIDKKTEVRRSVMADMRRLASLFVQFRKIAEGHGIFSSGTDCKRTVGVEDMFKRQNFYLLEEAFHACTKTGDAINPVKYGLVKLLFHVLLKAAKILKVIYLVKEQQEESKEVQNFLDLLNYAKNDLIAAAEYNNNKNRQTKLRRPQNLPALSDVQKLKDYTIERTKSFLDDKYLKWSASEFIELRDMTCLRLTLFNARRGGEPARLMLSDWQDALNQVWFDPARIEALPEQEKEVFSQNLIMYHMGKGIKRLVPVIVPHDTRNSLATLADAEIRQICGIAVDNNYLFPSTSGSEGHVSGWHAINSVCEKAGIEKSKITATKMRHLISTMYAALDIPENKRQIFFQHMGHAKEINEHIYQAPPAELEMLQVGSVLRQFDNGDLQISNHAAGNGPTRNKATGHGQTSSEEDSDSLTPVDYYSEPDAVKNMPLNICHDGKQNSTCKIIKMQPKQRRYTQWKLQDSQAVISYFHQYITGEKISPPGKVEILQFKDRQPQIVHDWMIIKTKVLNEKNSYDRRRKQQITKLMFSS